MQGTVAISGAEQEYGCEAHCTLLLAMKSRAKLPLPWNLAVISELVILLESRQLPSALKRVCEPLCVFENYTNFMSLL